MIVYFNIESYTLSPILFPSSWPGKIFVLDCLLEGKRQFDTMLRLAQIVSSSCWSSWPLLGPSPTTAFSSCHTCTLSSFKPIEPTCLHVLYLAKSFLVTIPTTSLTSLTTTMCRSPSPLNSLKILGSDASQAAYLFLDLYRH